MIRITTLLKESQAFGTELDIHQVALFALVLLTQPRTRANGFDTRNLYGETLTTTQLADYLDEHVDGTSGASSYLRAQLAIELGTFEQRAALIPGLAKLEDFAERPAQLRALLNDVMGRRRMIDTVPPPVNGLALTLAGDAEAICVLDLGCGTGGLLLEAAARAHAAGRAHDMTFVGVDIDPHAVAVTELVLALAGVRHQIIRGDVLPPSELKATLAERGLADVDCVLCVPPATGQRGALLDYPDWLSAARAVASSEGRIVFIAPAGMLGARTDHATRRLLVEEFGLTRIVVLPRGAARIHGTGIALLELDPSMGDGSDADVTIVDASRIGDRAAEGALLRVDMRDAIDLLHAVNDDRVMVVGRDAVRAKDYALTPGAYQAAAQFTPRTPAAITLDLDTALELAAKSQAAFGAAAEALGAAG